MRRRITIDGIGVDGGESIVFGADGIWGVDLLFSMCAAITLWIAGDVVIRNCDIRNAFWYDPELKCLGEPGGRRRLLVNMPMNMDYAHYRGYEGKPIYEKIDGEMKWWHEEKGKFKSE